MRKAVTLRLETDLLEEVRHCAEVENRTMTNFIETAVKQRVAGLKAAAPQPDAAHQSDLAWQRGATTPQS